MKYLVVFLLVALPLSAKEFHVDRQAENVVKFISETSLEGFEGITDRIDGYAYYKDDSLALNSEFYFQVELATIKTGIGLRDRHMREKYLETDTYPYASYKGKITNAEMITADSIQVETNGEFTVHGITNQRNISGALVRTDSGWFVQAEFKVDLNDHNIEIPQVMFLKLAETQTVVVEFYVKPAGEK